MNSAGTPIRFFISLISVIVILVNGCAKSVPPPGGPPDTTPPEFITSLPASASTGISTDTEVIIYFSEPLDPRSVARAVFITPQPDSEPKIKARGSILTINFPSQLLDDRTYVLTVGTDLRDAHNVRLAQSLNIAFSTGDKIDQGSISGTVYLDTKPMPNISLALFENIPPADSPAADSLIPDYLTQSGENGLYRFGYLPRATYYLVAFEDKNKNRRINPATEMIGLPFQELVLSTEQTSILKTDIRLFKQETGITGLKSVSVNPDRLVKIRFDKSLSSDQAGNLIDSAIIVPVQDSSNIYRISGFTNINPYPSTDFLALAAPLQENQEYRVKFDRSLISDNLPDSLRWLVYTFKFPQSIDQQSPELLDSDPTHNDSYISVDKKPRLLFSEPIDSIALASAVSLVGCQDDTLPLRFIPVRMFLYEAQMMDSLDYGCEYNIIIDEKLIRDEIGNVMGDSIKQVSFTTIGKDTLGSLSGELIFAQPEDSAYPVMLEFKPTADEPLRNLYLDSGERLFNSEFSPGYYSITAYMDKNANRRYDPGTIIPYQLAEPFTTVVDTFRVRTRFETTGVKIEF